MRGRPFVLPAARATPLTDRSCAIRLATRDRPRHRQGRDARVTLTPGRSAKCIATIWAMPGAADRFLSPGSKSSMPRVEAATSVPGSSRAIPPGQQELGVLRSLGPGQRQLLELQRVLGNAEVVRRLADAGRPAGNASDVQPATQARTLIQRELIQRELTAADAQRVDAVIDASPLIKSLVGGWASLGFTVASSMTLFGEAEFRVALDNYMQGKINPLTNALYRSSDIDTLAPRINGYTVPGIAVHVKKTVGIGTIVHEGMHLYQKADLPWHASEGFTEFFTRWLCSGANLPRDKNYEDQLAAVDRLAAVTNPETMGAAYFDNRFDALIADVNKSNFNRWATWTGFMAVGDFVHANALFAPSGLSAGDRGALEQIFSGPSSGSSPVTGPSIAPVSSSGGGSASGSHAPRKEMPTKEDPFAVLWQQSQKEFGSKMPSSPPQSPSSVPSGTPVSGSASGSQALGQKPPTKEDPFAALWQQARQNSGAKQ